MQNTGQEGEWSKLGWKEKMDICQNGLAHEESLLNTYVTLFIAVEALFFACVLTGRLIWWFNIIIAVIAILTVFRFVKTFYDRGSQVDFWGTLIYELLRENSNNDALNKIRERYEGCSSRINKKWYEIIFGWHPSLLKNCFWGYSRRLLTTLTPLIVVVSWIVVIIVVCLFR